VGQPVYKDETTALTTTSVTTMTPNSAPNQAPAVIHGEHNETPEVTLNGTYSDIRNGTPAGVPNGTPNRITNGIPDHIPAYMLNGNVRQAPNGTLTGTPPEVLNGAHPLAHVYEHTDVQPRTRSRRQQYEHTAEDFEDVVTTWGTVYTTPELVRSSPFYTQTQIHTDSAARRALPSHTNQLTRVVHATHPIPRTYLHDLGPAGLLSLGEGLEEQRWEAVRDEDFRERVNETLRRIDDMLESGMGVVEPGSRFFNGREPSEGVRRGMEERAGCEDQRG
jgi:hypothetical protein